MAWNEVCILLYTWRVFDDVCSTNSLLNALPKTVWHILRILKFKKNKFLEKVYQAHTHTHAHDQKVLSDEIWNVCKRLTKKIIASKKTEKCLQKHHVINLKLFCNFSVTLSYGLALYKLNIIFIKLSRITITFLRRLKKKRSTIRRKHKNNNLIIYQKSLTSDYSLSRPITEIDIYIYIIK